jgi:hypothetical protein
MESYITKSPVGSSGGLGSDLIKRFFVVHQADEINRAGQNVREKF